MECFSRRFAAAAAVTISLALVAKASVTIDALAQASEASEETRPVRLQLEGALRLGSEERQRLAGRDAAFGFRELPGKRWVSVNAGSRFATEVSADTVRIAAPALDKSRNAFVAIADPGVGGREALTYDAERLELLQARRDGWSKVFVNSPSGIEVRFVSTARRRLDPGERIFDLQLQSDLEVNAATAMEREIVLRRDGVPFAYVALSAEPASNTGRALLQREVQRGERAQRLQVFWIGERRYFERGDRLVLALGVSHGGATRLADGAGKLRAADWRAENFGSWPLRVSTAGDVNGDRFSDLIVGAQTFDNGERASSGRVYVYHGGPEGLSLQPDFTESAGNFGARFGFEVAPAGDVDGDGYGEILVGAPGGQHETGTAYLYQGGAGGLAGTGRTTIHPSITMGQLGYAAGYVGDTNADGFDDFFVTAPTYDHDLRSEDKGAVFVWYGQAGWFTDGAHRHLTSGNAPWTANGVEHDVRLGTSASTAGDFNSDGFADLLVGAPNIAASFMRHADGSTTTPARFGRTLIWNGSASGLSRGDVQSAVFPCCAPNKLYGSDVSVVGALGKNAEPAVLDFTPYYVYSSDRQDIGGVRISTRGDLTILDGSAASRFFGARTLGDMDGDGYPEFGIQTYVPAENRTSVRVHFGGRPSGTAPVELDDNVSDFATAGDVNGDGFSDTAVVSGSTVVVYYGTPSQPAATPYWTINDAVGFTQSNVVGFGKAITARGDFNGDGFADIAIGAPETTLATATRAGVVTIHYGPLRGAAGSIRRESLRHQAADTEFGHALASLDFDNDGFDDLVVGAPGWSDGQLKYGAAFIFKGTSQGISTAATGLLIKSDRAAARFGHSLAYAGDLNDDGFGDLIVGAPGYHDVNAEEGAAFVYLGRAAGQAITADWLATGKQPLGHFGWKVAGARDLNGDGREEIVVAAPDFNAGLGAVFTWRGGDPGPVTQGGATGLGPSGTTDGAHHRSDGPHPDSGYGYDVELIGDVNGDGRSEILVGIPFLVSGGVRVGGVSLQYAGVFPHLMAGDQFEGKFGAVVAAGGDINHDGFADFAVAAPYFDVTDTGNDGRVYVWFSRPGQQFAYSLQNADLVLNGAAGSPIGITLEGATDVDGDGLGDLIVAATGGTAATGEVRIYSRASASTRDSRTYRFVSQSRVDAPHLLARWDRSDSPGGFRILSEVRNPFAKLPVTLEYRITEYGRGPHLLQAPTHTLPAFTVPGTGAGFSWRAFRNISGIAPGLYVWMARFNYDNPYFPWSPWMTIPGGTRAEPSIIVGAANARTLTAVFNSTAIGSPESPLEYRFDGTASTSVNGDVSSYAWDLGDGETAAGPVVTHAYAMPGIYEVTLRVADAVGNVGSHAYRVKVLSPDARRLNFTKLAGQTGGNPANTAIYKAGLTPTGLARVRSLIILDQSWNLQTSYGAWSGMDFDAVSVLPQDCAAADCVTSGSSLVSAGNGASLLRPGEQVAPVAQRLFGASEFGTRIDNAVATVDDFDANGAIAVAAGFASIGNGGMLAFNFDGAVDAGGRYLYIGESNDNGELQRAEIYVSERALPVPGLRAVLGPQGGTVSGSGFVFTAPPGALTDRVELSFIEERSSTGDVRLSITPSLRYALPVQIFFENVTAPIYKLSINPPALVASTAVSGGGRFMSAYSNSEWGTASTPTPCPGGVPNCLMQEFTGSGSGSEGCIENALDAFDTWARETGWPLSADAGGFNYSSCQHDHGLVTRMTATPVSNPAPCVADATRMCRTWQVGIPANRPGIDSFVVVPGRNFLRSLLLCASEQATVDALYDRILAHELTHADINNTANVGMDATLVTLNEVPEGTTTERIKLSAFMQECQLRFMPRLQEAHDVFHSIEPHFEQYSASDDCGRCGSPEQWDRCEQPSYCGCDDPSRGKPRDYASAIECAVNCPSGLRCFPVLCTIPPSCSE